MLFNLLLIQNYQKNRKISSNQEFMIINFITNFYQNYFLRNKNYKLLLLKINSQLVKNIIYIIIKNISFNLNILF